MDKGHPTNLTPFPNNEDTVLSTKVLASSDQKLESQKKKQSLRLYGKYSIFLRILVGFRITRTLLCHFILHLYYRIVAYLEMSIRYKKDLRTKPLPKLLTNPLAYPIMKMNPQMHVGQQLRFFFISSCLFKCPVSSTKWLINSENNRTSLCVRIFRSFKIRMCFNYLFLKK